MIMVQMIIHAFNHHGYLVLFTSLFLELLALPLPGELLMGSAGLLVFEGKLNWLGIIMVGGLGASIGMTISYMIGYRLGMPFVQKYGKYVHFGPDKLDRTSQWFATYGNKLLAIAYFIPGLRHFTGYFAGIVRIPFRTFALYAYTGAFLWVGTFVTIGKLLGPEWKKFHSVISKYLLIGGALLIVLLLMVYVWKKHRDSIMTMLKMLLSRALHTFHSLGRVKLVVTLTATACLLFSLLTIGLVQEYLANEFDQFDEVVKAISGSLQEDLILRWVKPASVFISLPAEIVVVIMITIWILVKGRDRGLETISLVITVVGGELWGELLTGVFHRIGTPAASAGSGTWTDIGFPSEPTLSAVILYGYAALLLFRQSSLIWLKSAVIPGFIALLLWIGVNDFMVNNQLPSNIVAGFSFGGVWVTLQVVLLEVFRMLARE
jgi:membrane protein DedA with SNARE-associated domain